jgi:hypothetical protein
MYVRPSDSENFQSWPSTKQKLAQTALKIRNCSFIQSESVVFRTDFCKTEFLAAGPDLKTVRLGLNGGASELCMWVGDVRPACLPSAPARNRKRNVWTWNGSSLVEGTGTPRTKQRPHCQLGQIPFLKGRKSTKSNPSSGSFSREALFVCPCFKEGRRNAGRPRYRWKDQD